MNRIFYQIILSQISLSYIIYKTLALKSWSEISQKYPVVKR